VRLQEPVPLKGHPDHEAAGGKCGCRHTNRIQAGEQVAQSSPAGPQVRILIRSDRMKAERWEFPTLGVWLRTGHEVFPAGFI
jgi:mannosyltransferase OCH1-like enzyme